MPVFQGFLPAILYEILAFRNSSFSAAFKWDSILSFLVLVTVLRSRATSWSNVSFLSGCWPMSSLIPFDDPPLDVTLGESASDFTLCCLSIYPWDHEPWGDGDSFDSSVWVEVELRPSSWLVGLKSLGQANLCDCGESVLQVWKSDISAWSVAWLIRSRNWVDSESWAASCTKLRYTFCPPNRLHADPYSWYTLFLVEEDIS